MFKNIFRREKPVAPQPERSAVKSPEVGRTASPENSLKYMYQRFWVDPDLRQSILDVRAMDLVDGRIKKIHRRMARDVTKGGLLIRWQGKENKRVTAEFKRFVKRLGLNRRAKLTSDARGAVMEGNLVLQWVISDRAISGCVRMPAETILPQVTIDGRFKDDADAYHQMDLFSGRILARFPRWKLSIGRFDPDNYDDNGSMGRPYLDANRTVWKKLCMTEEDLVIRRRHRAPQKLGHFLEGASAEDLADYENKVRNSAGEIETDYFSNRKGTIQNITGDANLDQIADVGLLLDCFFAGAPAPKGLFGYVDDLARDVLEDLKKDYYAEIDSIQDAITDCYREGFELQLLLAGILPESHDFEICFAERATETQNQRADRALKYLAMNVPYDIVWREAGLDPVEVLAKLEEQRSKNSPYPGNDDPEDNPTGQRVNVTPGNAPKGESATSVSNN